MAQTFGCLCVYCVQGDPKNPHTFKEVTSIARECQVKYLGIVEELSRNCQGKIEEL